VQQACPSRPLKMLSFPPVISCALIFCLQSCSRALSLLLPHQCQASAKPRSFISLQWHATLPRTPCLNINRLRPEFPQSPIFTDDRRTRIQHHFCVLRLCQYLAINLTHTVYPGIPRPAVWEHCHRSAYGCFTPARTIQRRWHPSARKQTNTKPP
jgi:hypothetical protein